jgi:hypothetical protein
VVDHEVHGTCGVDLLWFSSELDNGVSHSCEVYYGWNSGKVLKKDSSWLEGNLNFSLASVDPVENVVDVF